MASTKKTQTLRPCECSKFEILVNVRENDINGDLIWDEEITTGCRGTQTARTFAPGHDAKLKGFLIRAGIAGHEVTRNDGGMAVTSSPITIAEGFGFGQMVRSGIAGGLVKAELRKIKRGEHSEVAAAASASLADIVAAEEAAHEAAELTAREAQQREAEFDAEPETVTAKVGRWSYDGTVESDTFTYTDKKGETKSTTKFELV